ncbi:MAG: hypothetical protein JNK58_08650 [Phycisphaerae bacterium]|nr:hypothetical protein [Phycisphaerae bacterium]
MKNRTNRSFRLPCLLGLGFAAAISPAASAAVIRVNAGSPVLGNGASWAQAMPHLSDALAAAQPGDEIWVVTGSYRPDTSGNTPAGTNDRNASFTMKNGVRILGGFAGTETSSAQRNPAANPTILTGDIGAQGSNADNSYNIVKAINVNSLALLDGFTLKLGNANGGAAPDTTYLGGGIYVTGGAPVISNCRFENNSAFGGGSISILGGSTARITTCYFTGSYAWSGGCIRAYGVSPVIADSTFEANTGGYGGAIDLNESAGGRVERCRFINNHGVNGGAISAAGFTTTVFDACEFRKNRAQYLNAFQQRWNGGAVHNWCSGTTWVNCVFNGNTCNGNGGALYDGGPSGTRPTVINCTVFGNYSRDGGAIAADPGHTPLIRNTIVWTNTVSAGDPSLFGGVVVERSNVQGLSPLTGDNMSIEPQFVSPLGNDGMSATGDENFSLFGTSPLIDAGNNTHLPADIIRDYAGNNRLLDGNADSIITVDLGAYEFVLPPPPHCYGDANGDRVVNFADITNTLSNWGAPGPEGDADDSGIVNFADITATLTAWGSNCNPA